MAAPSPTLVCPSCKAQIPLTESLAAPMIEAARAELEQKLEARLTEARAGFAAAEQKKARAAMADELEQARQQRADLDATLRDREAKLAEARRKEVELLQAQRALEDQKASLDLDVERRLQEERTKIREEARRGADEENRLRMAEKDKKLSDVQQQLEEMRRKAEQGSQQLQGEVMELDFEALLRTSFPQDVIAPVPKGEHGGDILQRVHSSSGQPAGTILWEFKNTKHFAGDWTQKVRDNQRAAKAELGILATKTLPKEVEIFGFHEGVWVTAIKSAVAVAACLRQGLLELWAARRANDGLETKQALVYEYMTGPQFRQRMGAIAEAFHSMKEDLDKEKKAIMKVWAKREMQLNRVLIAATGMRGDLEGIAGKELPPLEVFELKILEAPDEDLG